MSVNIVATFNVRDARVVSQDGLACCPGYGELCVSGEEKEGTLVSLMLNVDGHEVWATVNAYDLQRALMAVQV